MKIKLDENLSRHLKPILNTLHHDSTTALEEGLLGQADTHIGRAARTEGRMLFTLDLEFGDLRKHPPGNHPGIILFRPRVMGPLSVNEFITGFVMRANLDEYAGCVVVVESDRIRVRRPPL